MTVFEPVSNVLKHLWPCNMTLGLNLIPKKKYDATLVPYLLLIEASGVENGLFAKYAKLLTSWRVIVLCISRSSMLDGTEPKQQYAACTRQ